MIVEIELTLVSIIQGVALTFLIENGRHVIAIQQAEFWPYLAAGLLVILVFWSRSVLDRVSDPLPRPVPPWPSPRTSQGPAVCVGMRGRRQCRLELIVCGADHSQTDHQRKVAVLQRR